MRRPFFYRESNGIRITVRPWYVPERSEPRQREYVFAYRVRIENVGAQAARLLTRRWRIEDVGGEATELVGEGVVGQQPLIEAGGVHEYQSFAVLKASEGWMEGQYQFRRADGTSFDAAIPRFHLDVEAPGRQ